MSLYKGTTKIKNVEINNLPIGWFPSVKLLSDNFTSSSTGTLTKGSKIYNFTAKSSSILPSGYQEVSYIKSSGTQYINTSYVPNATTKVVINSFTKSYDALTDWESFMGSQSSDNASDTTCLFRWSKKTYASGYIADYASSNRASSNIQSSVSNIVVSVDQSFFIFNGISYSYSGSTGYVAATYPLFIFAVNQGGTATRNASCQMGKILIYDNNQIVRNLIPCYRTSDNEIGMYDTVNNVFYENQGTGDFEKGSNVNPNYLEVEKITELGTYTYNATEGSTSATGTVNVAQPIEYDVSVELT